MDGALMKPHHLLPGLICDNFAGGGGASTGIAALRAGKRFYGIEEAWAQMQRTTSISFWC
jgi:hypothetical protein